MGAGEKPRLHPGNAACWAAPKALASPVPDSRTAQGTQRRRLQLQKESRLRSRQRAGVFSFPGTSAFRTVDNGLQPGTGLSNRLIQKNALLKKEGNAEA
jgi:hypothetical protein